MLLFSSDTFTVDGITVFPDHADPNQFWYLPGPVGLETQGDTADPQFLLIMYAPDVAGTGIQGTGFLEVTLALKVSAMTQTKIIGQIRAQFPQVSDPTLAPVSFDAGTVQIVALDLQGSGGTSAGPAAGGGVAVQKILGASSPELFGNNDAVFGLTLTEEGATILNAAFKDGMAPVGGIYNMQFTGVLPALDVKITCDLKRVYDSFSVDLTAQAYFVSAGIDATFEKLRQDGTIKIDVISLSSDAATLAEETWALNLFKDQIMAQWFTPSLSPTTAAAADAQSVSTGAKPVTGTTGTTTTTTTTKPANSMGGSTTPTTSGGMNSASNASGMGAKPTTPTTTTATPTPTTPTTTPTTTAPVTPTASGAPATTTTTTAPAKPAAPAIPAAVAKPIAQALGTAAAASSAASPFGLALRLKFVSQDELKTVEMEFNQMNAVQRTYSPQGYFGALLQNADQSKLFLQVDGTSPFFKDFAVTVAPPPDFAGIGLLSAHVAMDYGDPSSANGVKHGEFVFTPQQMTQQVWSVFQGMIQQTAFTYTVDYTFDPESGWQGATNTYVLPAVTTENRLLTLDPHNFLGFLSISIQAGRIDTNTVDRIEVAITYTAAGTGGWQTSTTIVVRPGLAPQFFKLRLADPNDRSYTYATTCYLKDGTSIARPPTTTAANALIISDPFAGGLDLTFEPAFDPTAVTMAIVELAYADSADNYNFTTTFQMLGTSQQPVHVHVPLIDPTQHNYQYRVTLLDHSNQKTQGNYVSAQDPLVLVSAGA